MAWGWDSGLPGPEVASKSTSQDAALRGLKQVGWLGPAPGVLFYADPIALPHERPEGEGPKGLEVLEHPQAMLLGNPELWDPVERYRSGYRREPSEDEWDECSAFEASVWAELRAAEFRRREWQDKEKAQQR